MVTTLRWKTLVSVFAIILTQSSSNKSSLTVDCINRGSCNKIGLEELNGSGVLRNGIKALDLSSNKLKRLVGNIFEGLTSVISLNLQSNEISEIDDLVFKGLENVKEITLSENKLKNISLYIIQNNTKVQHLFLKGNKITIPKTGPLIASNSLTELNMEFCGIEELTNEATFSMLPKLDELILNGNSLKKLDIRVFNPLMKSLKLVRLRLYNNTPCTYSVCKTISILRNQSSLIVDTDCETDSDKCEFTNNYANTSSKYETKKWGNDSKESTGTIDVFEFLVILIIITCSFVIVLVLFICYVQCSVFVDKRKIRNHLELNAYDTEQPHIAPIVQEVDRPQIDPDNEGYETPMPRGFIDEVRNLDNAPPMPYGYFSPVDDNFIGAPSTDDMITFTNNDNGHVAEMINHDVSNNDRNPTTRQNISNEYEPFEDPKDFLVSFEAMGSSSAHVPVVENENVGRSHNVVSPERTINTIRIRLASELPPLPPIPIESNQQLDTVKQSSSYYETPNQQPPCPPIPPRSSYKF